LLHTIALAELLKGKFILTGLSPAGTVPCPAHKEEEEGAVHLPPLPFLSATSFKCLLSSDDCQKELFFPGTITDDLRSPDVIPGR
jgi:hypothetical protein